MAYLTIKEYAELKHITTQTVYKKIRTGKLETITKTVDGTEKKYIFVDAPTVEPAPETATGGTQAAPQNEMTMLEQTLQALTAQLAEKDKQIAKLQDLLDHAQQLQGHAQVMLEAPAPRPPEQAAPTDETEKHKKYNFWEWLASI